MKRFFMTLLPCVAITLSIGCGKPTDNSVVEVEALPEDQQLVEETMNEYDSADYKKQMGN